MERRRLLALVGGLSAGLAGCTQQESGERMSPTPATGQPDLPVPESDLVRGAPRDAIPAITNPVFGTDWSGVEAEARGPTGQAYTVRPRLSDDDPVIGVERGGEARAYPLAVLNWHEAVNDTFGGPLLVTYCPLCGSAVAAERTVNGDPAVFGVSGLLYRHDLVLYDRPSDSLWSQLLATAIRGPRTGDRLSLVPSSLTTLGAWRGAHPDTRVLRPPPESGTVAGRVTRNYATDPYVGYQNIEDVGLSDEEFRDNRLHPKTRILGIESDGTARAYPRQAVVEAGVISDRVGDLVVVVTAGPDGTLAGYDRRVDGRALSVAAGEEGTLQAGGSRWDRLTGHALDGPFEGERLAPVGQELFWFAWLEFHPESQLWRE